MKTTKQKWFYPAQEKISDYLKQKFGDCYRSELQNVCKHVAYETYKWWEPYESGKQQESGNVTFIIYKNIAGRTNAPAIIQVMHSVYEDTMQYFQTEKEVKQL